MIIAGQLPGPSLGSSLGPWPTVSRAAGSSARRCARLVAIPIQLAAIFLGPMITNVATAAPNLTVGSFNEFNIELPAELRKIAGRGKVSPITNALVTIAVPANADPSRELPVLVISATGDPGDHSSRRLMRQYADAALGAGWMVVAADPDKDVAFEEDDAAMRMAINTAALSVLAQRWPRGSKAPLAFGGFSGGSKYSGWLAAAFAGQGRTVIGVFLAGCNEDTLTPAAVQFKVLADDFKRVPVYLLSGEKDVVSTPTDHQNVVAHLKESGFQNVWLEYFPGQHEIDPAPLRAALDWFRTVAALPTRAK